MEAIRSENFKSAIVQIQILDDNSLLVVDSKSTIRYLNIDSLELMNGFKANISHRRYKNKVLQFSNDGLYFATLSSDCRESRLYNAKAKKLITQVDRHHGEVSCVGVDPRNQYMFSCGDDGKTFAIDVVSGKLAFTLPVHVDTINDIAFSSNGSWVATCSYDKKISLFNLKMMVAKHTLISHTSPIMNVAFIEKNRLISIDKDDKAIVWNILSGKVLARLEGIHDSVVRIVTAENSKFLFLGTILGYVLVYDLETYELLSKKFIKLHSPITSMTFDEEMKELIVGCDNGDLLFYDIYEGEEYITTLLKERKYEQIQAHVETNPILQYTEIYTRVQNLWDNTLAKAKKCLEKEDRKTAVLLLSYFKNIPEKNKIIQHVLAEYMDYAKFVDLAKRGKLVLAYSIANQHPMYKEAAIYKAMEKQWQKTFAIAQKYALDPKGTDKARDILAPYRGISDKTKLMQELFTQGEVYKRFKIAIGQKDFKIVFELIKLHPFLMEFPEYITLMNYADTLYIKSQEFINEGDTHAAIKMLRILIDFPDFALEAKELMTDIESQERFHKAMQDEDIVLAYNMLDRSETLQSTKDGKMLQDKWNEDLAMANGFAVEGNVAGIEETLKEYMSINSKYTALASIFGWCYMIQIELAIDAKKDKYKIEEGIKNYILNFGLQDQILSLYEIFIQQFPSSKLNLELLKKGSIRMWRPSMIVQSILD